MKTIKCNKISRILIALTVSFVCFFTATSAVKGGNTVELMGRKFTAYKVNKKESLYAISRNLGVSYDSLTLWNQGFDSEVPKGYTLYLPQGIPSEPKPKVKSVRNISYKVKYGDTLYAIANKYHTTVEDIIRLNPSLRSSVLPADAEITVPENSAYQQLQPVGEMREGIVSFKYYKIRKNESVEGICRNYRISQELLHSANPGIEIKRNAIISIPVLGQVQYLVYRHVADSRETTSAGQQAIFDSIASSHKNPGTTVAVLLSNPQSNKDVDFSRGLLTAAREFGRGSRNLDIKFVNASREGSDLTLDPALQEAEIIFTTYDGAVPAYLTSFAERSGKTLINAFSVRDTLYRTNPAMINLLSSPQEFNAQVARNIIENFGTSYFVFLGDPLKSQDQIANQIMNSIDPENFDVVESLEEVIPHPSRPMVFYSLGNTKNEMKRDLEAIATWMTRYPAVDVNTIGRPSWIVYVDTYPDALKQVHANVPTRFYFAEKDADSNQFLRRYHEFFKADPVRSYPAYSVMGYDAAWYFLRPGAEHQYLQMPFRLTRIPGGGEYNSSAFMLRYFPSMPVTKFDIVPYLSTDE